MVIKIFFKKILYKNSFKKNIQQKKYSTKIILRKITQKILNKKYSTKNTLQIKKSTINKFSLENSLEKFL